MNNIDAILTTIEEFQPLPHIAIRALELLDDPDVSSSELISIIQYDQGITANVLRISNSAYYGKRRRINSLAEGLVVLGNKALKEIILTSSVAKIFSTENKGYQKATGELWKHAASTAIMARLVAKHAKIVEDALLFTTALLHDIGKLVLDSFVERYFEQIISLVLEKNYSFIEAEKEMLSINHAEVGALLAEKWQFPKQIVESIRLHHTPELASQKDMITPIVHLANILTTLLGIGAGLDTFANRGKGEILKRLKLTGKDIQIMMVSFYEDYQELEDLLCGGFQNGANDSGSYPAEE